MYMYRLEVLIIVGDRMAQRQQALPSRQSATIGNLERERASSCLFVLLGKLVKGCESLCFESAVSHQWARIGGLPRLMNSVGLGDLGLWSLRLVTHCKGTALGTLHHLMKLGLVLKRRERLADIWKFEVSRVSLGTDPAPYCTLALQSAPAPSVVERNEGGYC